MKPIDRIRVNDCLQFREAAFVDIYEAEKQIEEILGESFPLGAPELDLPSTFRPDKGKKKRARRKSITIRNLHKENENAYRVTYEENGEKKVRLLRSVQFIRQLMRFELALFRMLRVEAVYCDNEEDIEVIEVVYDAEREGDV